MQTEQIKQKIEQSIANSEVHVEGDGRHFQVIVVSTAFAGKSTLQQHQMIYQVLGNSVGKEIHALSIRTYTPEDWQRQP